MPQAAREPAAAMLPLPLPYTLTVYFRAAICRIAANQSDGVTISWHHTECSGPILAIIHGHSASYHRHTLLHRRPDLEPSLST